MNKPWLMFSQAQLSLELELSFASHCLDWLLEDAMLDQQPKLRINRSIVGSTNTMQMYFDAI